MDNYQVQQAMNSMMQMMVMMMTMGMVKAPVLMSQKGDGGRATFKTPGHLAAQKGARRYRGIELTNNGEAAVVHIEEYVKDTMRDVFDFEPTDKDVKNIFLLGIEHSHEFAESATPEESGWKDFADRGIVRFWK